MGQQKISGKVIDTNNDPLIGVTIQVKGTSVGTLTDVDGGFSLNKPAGATEITVSYIGFASQDIDISNKSEIMVTLLEETAILDEVVVIGYARQKKSVVTGAVSSVDVTKLRSRAPGQLQSSIQGTVAGVSITPTSGAPDAGFKVKIRGTGSNGPTEPLYVVDGMRTRDISFLEANAIQSFEILKDAASASIYGAEGANGVVLITTNNGTKGAKGLSYGVQFGSQSYRGKMELMNTTQWKDYLTTAGVDTDGISTATNTNWLDELFQNAPMMRHNLSFSGGNEELSYFFGANYFDQAGIIGGADKSNFKRLSGNFGLQAKPTEWLTVGTNMTVANEATIGAANFGDVNVGGLISSAILMDPSTPATYSGALPQWVQDLGQSNLRTDANGNVYGLSQTVDGEIINPLIYIDQVNGDGNRSNTLFGSAFATAHINKSFSVTSRFGFDNTQGNFHNWSPAYYATVVRNSSVPSSIYGFYSSQSYQWENFANYNIDVNDDINIGLLAGTSVYNTVSKGLNGAASGLVSGIIEASFLDGSEAQSQANGFKSQQRIQSFFGRANLNVQDKYLFMASLRRDGTSLFTADNRWKAYPGLSAGWVFSREGFMGEGNGFSFGKLRASWGQAGSLASVGPGSGQSLITSIFSYAGQTSSDPTSLANPSLTWETSEQINIGLDLGFLGDRLTLSADYFDKKTKDLLTTSSPPGYIGNAAPLVNAGTMRNSGVELELGYKNRDNELKYQFTANITSIKNEVTELSSVDILQGSQTVGTSWKPTAFEVGQPAWYFRGYKTDGLNDDGTPNIIDTNGDGNITPEDYDFIGSPHPTLLYGGVVNLEYRGFDFTLFIQGQAGNDILMGYNRTDRATANKPTLFLDDNFFSPNVDGNGYFSDFMIFDGSFLRVKQIQLGYDLGSLIGGELKDLRVYASLEDYFTSTKYPGLDPEIGSQFDDAIGIDRGTYPIAGRIIFGATVNF